MGRSVKWVEEKLGITRDMLKYYERKGLLPKNSSRNVSNNYRDYDEKDLERLWGIRLLIKMGFSPDEILTFMQNPNFDFDAAIAQKVEKLEKAHDENLIYLQFAKSIKLSGRVPTVSEIGSVRFDEFLEYVHENWNFYEDPRTTPFMKAAQNLLAKPIQEWSPEVLELLSEHIARTGVEEIQRNCTYQAYYQIIADMQDMEHSSIPVQRTVRLLHMYAVQQNEDPELARMVSPKFFAQITAPCFAGGDIGKLYEQMYGKEGCAFIVRAIAHYGGCDVKDF